MGLRLFGSIWLKVALAYSWVLICVNVCGDKLVNVASACFNVMPYQGILHASIMFLDTNLGGVVKMKGILLYLGSYHLYSTVLSTPFLSLVILWMYVKPHFDRSSLHIATTDVYDIDSW